MVGTVYDFGEVAPVDLEAEGGMVHDFGPTRNQALQIQADETAAANRVQADDSGVDIPTLPDPNAPDSGQRDRPEEGLLSQVGRAVAPIANPVLEVMDSINNTVYGLPVSQVVEPMYLLGSTAIKNAENVGRAMTTEEEYAGVQWGDHPSIPNFLKNKTFVNNADDAEFLDVGGKYAGYGMNMTGLAKLFMSRLGQGILKYTNKGARLNPVTGTPFTGVETARVGMTRQFSTQAMPAEVDFALRMAGAGAVAEELSGSDSMLIKMPAEILSAMTRRPTTYFDIATGLVRDADTQIAVGVKRVKDEFEKKYGIEAIDNASSRARGLATDPYEAHLALQAQEAAGRETVLSPSQVMDDVGLRVGERRLAVDDPAFAGQIDDQMDLAQHSLAEEMKLLLDPATNTYNWKALEELMPRIQDDLLKGVDDSVRIAHENLQTMLKAYDGDVTKMSAEFKKEFDVVYDSVRKQEDVLWKPINDSGFQIDVSGFQKEIAAIVAASNRETNIPAQKFAEYLGAGLLRTDSGWKIVPMSVKSDKKALKKMGKVVWPEVAMGRMQSPQVMKSVRTSLNEMVRDPNVNVDMGAAVKAQSAAVQALTDGMGTVPESFRKTYTAATQYSKKVHETFTRGTVMPKVVKAVPEKKLEVAMGGAATASETTMNVVAREFKELQSLAPSTGKAAASNMMKQAGNMLKTKFANQVDASDLASFDLFIAQNKTAFERWPKEGEIIKAARAKAKRQGVMIKNREMKAEAARLDIFTNMTGKNPDQIMDLILKSANPLTNARRFKTMLSKEPEALQAFQDTMSRRLVGTSLDSLAAAIKGGTKVDTKQVVENAKMLEPLTIVFKKKDMQGMDMLIKELKSIEKAMQARTNVGAEKSVDGAEAIAMKMAARLGGIKAVSMVFGSSSIVLAGTASNLATKGLQAMSLGQTDKIMKEAYRNPELMKILLSRNITPTQLQQLNSGAFITGRSLYKAITGEINEQPVAQ
tara:strand:+ start:997 stop:3942 length:2946 start_codon:yes stop_codon:yes gene_type:complete